MTEAVDTSLVTPGKDERKLAALVIPAVLIGVVSALLFAGIDWVALRLEHVWWDALPHALGADPDSRWWILAILLVTGVAVALVLWKAPGHGGHDPATIELVAPVLPLSALPGVAAALILGLAGGVSLGPESPIIAIAVALAIWLVARTAPAIPAELTMLMAVSAMLGAMFGSPIAAALLLTEMVAAAKRGGLLWDRLFGPVAAAGAAALTMRALGQDFVPVELPAYDAASVLDVAAGVGIALVAALLGGAAAWSMPRAHALFRRLGHPLLYVTLGGLLLGLLGALGGPITLFKGAAQTAELIDDSADRSWWVLGGLAVIKTAALVIAAAAGFRGGRIFPAVFIGAAVGMAGAALVPGMSLTVALATGVLGAVLAIGRDGWLALFLAAAVVADLQVLALLCIIVLPTWLLVTRLPEMIVHRKDVMPVDAPSEETGKGPDAS